MDIIRGNKEISPSPILMKNHSYVDWSGLPQVIGHNIKHMPLPWPLLLLPPPHGRLNPVERVPFGHFLSSPHGRFTAWWFSATKWGIFINSRDLKAKTNWQWCKKKRVEFRNNLNHKGISYLLYTLWTKWGIFINSRDLKAKTNWQWCKKKRWSLGTIWTKKDIPTVFSLVHWCNLYV